MVENNDHSENNSNIVCSKHTDRSLSTDLGDAGCEFLRGTREMLSPNNLCFHLCVLAILHGNSKKSFTLLETKTWELL